MSLRFCFGPSGAGKSHRIYEEIMQRAAEEPGRNFLIIVPDQFTMQTQKDLVMRSDRDGILNIDVLSFGPKRCRYWMTPAKAWCCKKWRRI